MGGVGGYDQLCCPASPKLLLGLDLGLGCDKINWGYKIFKPQEVALMGGFVGWSVGRSVRMSSKNF